MANKAISELPQALNVNNQDLFVLEQSGIAKKLPAETFITEQGIINALAEALDGHGGIQSVTLSSVSGRIRTYRITFTDQSATTFQVYDGTSIDRISRTSSSGLDDVYTIFLSDGTTTFFTVHNGADGTVSEAMLNDALKDKAPAIIETTESSAIATFPDGADDLVMHNVIAEINPVQDLSNGDPSPDNICPITGHTEVNVTRTGANLWDEEWRNGYYNATSGIFVNHSSFLANAYPVYVKGSTTYYFASSYLFELHEYDKQGNYLGKTNNLHNSLFTTKSNTAYINFNSQRVNDETTYNHDISINYPSSDHDYHAYQSNTVTVNWQTEAGTVYGGTIDVATGLLTVDRTIVDMGTLTWVVSEVSSGRYYAAVNGIKQAAPRTLEIICSCFKPNVGGGAFENCSIYNVDSRLYAVNENIINDVSVFTESVIDQVAVYPLATPQTYLLTPQQIMTLLGTNNVWTDLSNVTVKYPADTKMFIEKLTIPTEDDLVANQAITSGKYFMIGNSLYLALANIASGAQITIGTNAQRVSLADALNTINS